VSGTPDTNVGVNIGNNPESTSVNAAYTSYYRSNVFDYTPSSRLPKSSPSGTSGSVSASLTPDPHIRQMATAVSKCAECSQIFKNGANEGSIKTHISSGACKSARSFVTNFLGGQALPSILLGSLIPHCLRRVHSTAGRFRAPVYPLIGMLNLFGVHICTNYTHLVLEDDSTMI
jgi:hypothetical protein